MNEEQRIASIMQVINEEKEFSLVEKLEFYDQFQDEKGFSNFLLILFVLIEKSKAYESASTLLLKKIYTQKVFKRNLTDIAYGDLFLIYVRRLAVEPYVNLSTTFRRLIGTIIYDKTGYDTANIVAITPKSALLTANELMLERYLQTHPMDEHIMSLFYNCVCDIEDGTFKITLSERACTLVRNKIMNGGLQFYLHSFLRPFYTSMSSFWLPDARYHVPEPFYEQIFKGAANFQAILKDQIDLHKRSISSELYEFTLKYLQNKDRGLEFLDIGPLNLTPEWHKNARFL